MQILTPNIKELHEISFPKETREPFNDETLHFIDSLSKKLLKDAKYKTFNELISLGFWLRRSNILILKEHFFQQHKNNIILPRGIVLHIAPSNVDTIFLYSFILSLLVGCHNIVRITQKNTPQIEPLLALVINELKYYPEIYNSTLLIRYAHEENITQKLSMFCDVRMIWGGDATIKHIRTIPIKPTAIELTFADKFSFLAINLNKTTLNNDFFQKLYRDTFTFMQKACSSSKAICFIDATQEEKNSFWRDFKIFVEKQTPDIEAKIQIDKLVALSSIAIEESVEVNFDTFVSYISLPSLKAIDEVKHCGGGLFYDIDIKNISELLQFSTKKHQTLTIAGISKQELLSAFYNTNPQGFDRVVKVGQAMEFNAIWDGYEIMNSLCRIIDVDI